MTKKKILSLLLALIIVFSTVSPSYAALYDYYYKEKTTNYEKDYTALQVATNNKALLDIGLKPQDYYQEGFDNKYYLAKDISDYKYNHRQASAEEIYANIDAYIKTDVYSLIDKSLDLNKSEFEENYYTKDSWAAYEKARADLLAIKELRFVKETLVLEKIAALEEAYENLVAGVNTEELEKKLAEAKSYNLRDYTRETADGLSQAIREAEHLLASNSITENAVQIAIKDLDEKINALEKNYDLYPVEVLAIPDQTIELGQELNLPEKVLVKMSDNSHIEINVNWWDTGDVFVNTPGRYEATTRVYGFDVSVFINVLDDLTTDKTGLVKAIENGQAFSPNKYSEYSYRDLREALERGLAVNNDINSSQGQIDQAEQDIIDAIARLKEEQPKDRIIYVIQPERLILHQGEDFVMPKTVKVVLNSGVEVEKPVTWSEDLTTENLGEYTAYGTIEGTNEKARLTIEIVAGEVMADKSKLEELVGQAKSLDTTNKTPASIKRLESEITSAENVLALANPSQELIDQAYADLEKAMKALEDKPTPADLTIVKPNKDLEVSQGQEVQIEVKAPSGGQVGYKIALAGSANTVPIDPNMEKTELGTYTATWKVPQGLNARNLKVFVSHTDDNGFTSFAETEGIISIVQKLTVTYKIEGTETKEEVARGYKPIDTPESEKEGYEIKWTNENGEQVDPKTIEIHENRVFTGEYVEIEGAWANLVFKLPSGQSFVQGAKTSYRVLKAKTLADQKVVIPEVDPTNIPAGQKIHWDLDQTIDKDTEVIASLVKDDSKYTVFDFVVGEKGSLKKADENTLEVLTEKTDEEIKSQAEDKVKASDYYQIGEIKVDRETKEITINFVEDPNSWVDVIFKNQDKVVQENHVHIGQTYEQAGITLPTIENIEYGKKVIWDPVFSAEKPIEKPAGSNQIIFQASVVRDDNAYVTYHVILDTSDGKGSYLEETNKTFEILDNASEEEIKAKAKELVKAEENYKISTVTIDKETKAITIAFAKDETKWIDITLTKTKNGNIKLDGTVQDPIKLNVPIGTKLSDLMDQGKTEFFVEDSPSPGYKWEVVDHEFTKENPSFEFKFKKDLSKWKEIKFIAGENGSFENTEAREITTSLVINSNFPTDQVPVTKADPGYKFIGWSTPFPQEVTEDLSYTANFEKDSDQWTTVKFLLGNDLGNWEGNPQVEFEAIIGQTFDYNNITIPKALADKGYKAVWNEEPTAETLVVKDKTYTVNFEKDDAQWVTLTFEAGENGSLEGQATQEVLKGSQWTEVSTPTTRANPGFKFEKWDPTLPNTVPEENTTYTASFIKDESKYATISFVLGQGKDFGEFTNVEPQEVLKGSLWSEIKLPTATAKFGYKVEYSPSLPEDLETSKVEASQSYTVSFVKDESKWHNVIFTAGEHGSFEGTSQKTITKNGLQGTEITDLPKPKADEGYVFKGWKPDLTENKVIIPENDIEYKAVFEPLSNLSYTISHIQVDENNNPYKNSKGEIIKIKADTVVENQTFAEIVKVPAPELENFVLADGESASKDLTIQKDNNAVEFRYKVKADSAKKIQDQVAQDAEVKVPNVKSQVPGISFDFDKEKRIVYFNFDNPGGNAINDLIASLAGSGIFATIADLEGIQKVSFGNADASIEFYDKNGNKKDANAIKGEMINNVEQIVLAFGLSEEDMVELEDGGKLTITANWHGINAKPVAEELGQVSEETIVTEDTYTFMFNVTDRKVVFNADGKGEFAEKTKTLPYRSVFGEENIPVFTPSENYIFTGNYLVSYIEYTKTETPVTDKKLTKEQLAQMLVEDQMVIKPIVEAKSTDSSLQMIKVNEVDLKGFNSETEEYNITLPLGTTEVPKVEGIANSDKATVSVTKVESLPGTSTIKVTAEDGSERTYKINFTVEKSKETGVKEIKVNNEPATVDEANDSLYKLELAEGVKAETITAEDIAITLKDSKATNTPPTSSDSGKTWTFTVTAEDGETTRNYTIELTEKVEKFTVSFAVDEESKEFGKLVDPQDYEVEKDTPWDQIKVPQAQPNEGYKAVWEEFPEKVIESKVYKVSFVKNEENWATITFNGNDFTNTKKIEMVKGTQLLEKYSSPELKEDFKSMTIKGWKLEGDQTNKIYSEEEIKNYTVEKDTNFNLILERKVDNIAYLNSLNFSPVKVVDLSDKNIILQNEGNTFKIAKDIVQKYLPENFELSNEEDSYEVKIGDEGKFGAVIFVKEREKLKVTLDLDGGKLESSTEIENYPGFVVESLEEPSKDNHKFVKWVDENGEEIKFPYTLSENTVFKAVYEKIDFSEDYEIGHEVYDTYSVVNIEYKDNGMKSYELKSVPIYKDGTDVSAETSFKFYTDSSKKNELTSLDLSNGGTTKKLYLVANHEGDTIEKDLYMKFGSVTIGKDNLTFMTIEDALAKANDGDQIVVKYNTSFASADIAEKIYGGKSQEVKAGVTLLLPFDETYSDNIEVAKSKQSSREFDRKNSFVDLTLPRGMNLIIKGTLIINASTNAGQPMSGVPYSNNYSKLITDTDSNISVESDGDLKAIGYLIGNGNLDVKSGATVLENMLVHDFRGGKRTLGSLFIFKGIYDKVFPLNQISLNNIEITTKIESGANYKAFAHLNMKGTNIFETVNFIGTEAFLGLESGNIVKQYNTQNGVMTFDLNGKVAFNDLKVQILTTKDKEVPLSGLFEININSNSVVDLNANLKLLPGSNVNIKSGGTLNIPQGKHIFVYDASKGQIPPKNGDGNDSYPRKLMEQNYRVIPKFNFSSTTQPNFIVDGTLNVSGSLGGKFQVGKNGSIIFATNDEKQRTVTIKEVSMNDPLPEYTEKFEEEIKQ